MGQVVDYVALVKANEKDFRKVLSAYPDHDVFGVYSDCAVSNWNKEKVEGIMVMAHADRVKQEIEKMQKAKM